MPSAVFRNTRPALTLLAAAAGLALAGSALLPWANRLNRQELDSGLRSPAPQTERTDALAQQVAFFSLGGLRSLAAELLTMDATDAWLQQDWPRARNRWQQITTLCPHRSNYWIRAARDMHKNAVAHTQARKDLDDHARAVMCKDYTDAAEDFLLRGIAANPQDKLLYLELAAQYEDLARRPQFAKAAAAYRRAVELGASPMYERWVFYNLCRIRGQEEAAWKLGRALFEQDRHRSPSLRCLLFALQNMLPAEKIPASRRLTPEQLFGSREKAHKQLRTYLHNSLHFPTAGVQQYLES